jgi:hypothetical protein
MKICVVHFYDSRKLERLSFWLLLTQFQTRIRQFMRINMCIYISHWEYFSRKTESPPSEHMSDALNVIVYCTRGFLN